MNELSTFESNIVSAFAGFGGTLKLSQYISMVRKNKNDLIKDEKSFGGDENISFWDYISDDIVSIITVFKPESLEVYVFKAPIFSVTPHLDKLTLAEVAELEKMLNDEFSINSPTAKVQRGLGEYWLSA